MAAWKAMPARSTSSWRLTSGSPATRRLASQPSATQAPSSVLIGRATLNSAEFGSAWSTSARHSVSARNSTGLTTRWSARHATPLPPGNSTGPLLTPNAVSTASGGRLADGATVNTLKARDGRRTVEAGTGRPWSSPWPVPHLPPCSERDVSGDVTPFAHVLGHERARAAGVPRWYPRRRHLDRASRRPAAHRPDLVRLRARGARVDHHRRRIPQGKAVERRPALQPLRADGGAALLQVRQRRGTDRRRGTGRARNRPTPAGAPLFRPGAGRRLRGQQRRRRQPQVLDAPDSLVVRRLYEAPAERNEAACDHGERLRGQVPGPRGGRRRSDRRAPVARHRPRGVGHRGRGVGGALPPAARRGHPGG